jgi:hypothetical protein
MLAAAAGPGHPAVAVLLGLAAAAVACVVVAMAWNVHLRQIQLAEMLARRQFLLTNGTPPAAGGEPAPDGEPDEPAGPATAAAGPGAGGVVAPVLIDGPDSLITGDQGRYRVRRAGNRQVMSWAVGGGSVSQTPDPAHPDELLVVADRPGTLTLTVRVRDGLTERRATKSVTATKAVPEVTPPVVLRIFLHGWGLVVVAVVLIGFAGALSALGDLSAAEFIALVSPLAALLGVVAAVRGAGDTDTRGPRSG